MSAKVLAYDALMWDNALATCRGNALRVTGYRRAFVGENTNRWGSPDHPCPQIGLLPGDSCEAVLFELPRGSRRHILRNLRQREGTKAESIRFRSGNGTEIRAHSFLRPDSARTWTDREALVGALRAAKGYVGTGPEYIRAMIHAMDIWKIDDPLIREVWEEVRR